jgi:hypothetical protein
MFLNKELVNINNKLYYVYRKVSKDAIKEGYLNDVKLFWDCPMVVKHNQNQDILLFLKDIPDAEYVTV